MTKGLYRKAALESNKAMVDRAREGVKSNSAWLEKVAHAEAVDRLPPTLCGDVRAGGFNKTEYQREYMRKRRAEAKKAKEVEW